MARAAGHEIAGLHRLHHFVHAAVVVAVMMTDRHHVERRDPCSLERGHRGVRVGPASIRAVLPSGDRIRIESPCPTSSTSIVTGLTGRRPAKELGLSRTA